MVPLPTFYPGREGGGDRGERISGVMEIYTGIDIVDTDRFRRAAERYGDRFINRVFTAREMAAIPARDKNLYLCISFSFKEAIWKAMPEIMQKDFYFRDIEVTWKRRKPIVSLKGKTDNPGLSLHFFTIANSVVTTAVLLQ